MSKVLPGANNHNLPRKAELHTRRNVPHHFQKQDNSQKRKNEVSFYQSKKKVVEDEDPFLGLMPRS